MGRVMRLVCALLIVGLATAHADPPPQQKIALTAKPSVVRVWGAYVATYELGGQRIPDCCAIGGSGTGFFITADGYIATNAHVVSDIADGDKVAKEKLYKQLLTQLNKALGREIARMTDAQLQNVLDAIKLVDLTKRNYVVLPNGEKLEYEIKQYGKPGSGRDAAILKVKIDNAPSLPIGDSTRTQVADQIVVIGYPGVADMQALLDEQSQLQASVTDGTVSSLKRATSGEQILQISAPITHGNSGGPALDMKGNVIGLATFGNESEIQGFNFLVAAATLKELVKDAKIEPKASKTLDQWRQGLEHYWRDEYSAAIERFREVETLFPLHSEAGALIRQSNEAKKEGKERKPPGGNGGLIAGLVIGGLVVVGGAGFMMSRRKRGPQPGLPPHGQPPGISHPHAQQPGISHPHAQHPHAQHPHAQHPHAQHPQQQHPHAQHPHAQHPPQQHYAPPQQHAPPQQQMYGRVQQPTPSHMPQPAPMQTPSAPPQMPGAPPQMPGAPMQMPSASPMPGQPGFAPQAPGHMHGHMPQHAPPQMPGHAPIAKTVAIASQPNPSGGIAPTAFGSLSIGSLWCTRGSLQGQRFSLTATGIIIGRQPGVAHVLVNDHRASGKHVWIGIDQGRLVAIDQGTTNGTYVNDVARGRITRAELRDGDVVIVSEPDCLSLQIRLS